ncbi:hypothetical protein ACHAW5_001845 [Stephanodiscus triporus]|uniref:Hexosyltransferase n=1 Tax=Stephanodiscus triporus TaxID=2934178 RepID=A0ABD3MLQ7_9STRA
MIEKEDAALSILLEELLEHRRGGRAKEADQVKKILLCEHSVRVYYRRDGTIGWSKVAQEAGDTEVGRRIVWSIATVVGQGKDDKHRNAGAKPSPQSGSLSRDIPLVVATVNTPSYRSRLAETMEIISSRASSFVDGTRFAPVDTIDLMNLSHHPSIGPNRILFEGWRRILLPTILSSSDSVHLDRSIVFVAEDDVRICNVSPGRIREVCSMAFDANPDLHILSLGHAYALARPNRRQRRRANRQCRRENEYIPAPPTSYSLLESVSRGKGLHGTTLLALRHPEGTRSLLNHMEAVPRGKRCHLDQFLFHSTLHNIGIALSDPPLAGWGEVSETLSSVGSGCRRNGGGRLEQLPAEVLCDEIQWVRRDLS